MALKKVLEKRMGEDGEQIEKVSSSDPGDLGSGTMGRDKRRVNPSLGVLGGGARGKWPLLYHL